jgi:hypothetical protein
MAAAAAPAAAAACALDEAFTHIEAALVAKQLGRWARASELFARALASVRDRAREREGRDDSLVLAYLTERRASLLMGQQMAPGAALGERRALCAEWWAHTQAVVAVLRARLDADTLLPGACQPEEVAFRARYAAAAARVEDTPADVALNAGRRAADAGLIGYGCCMDVAYCLLNRLHPTHLTLPELPPDEAAAAQAFVLRLVGVVGATLRVPFYMKCAEEMRLCHLLAQMLPSVGHMEPRFQAALRAAWEAAPVAAALRAHGCGADTFDAVERNADAQLAAAARDAARCGLRACAAPACGAREASGKQFKLCSACKAAAYCSPACQRAHWREHKPACKQAAAPQ